MKIHSCTYTNIINLLPDIPPEIGGILGGRDDIVSEFMIDNGIRHSCPCRYIPDVNKLNECIKEWMKRGIEFYGIFHVHFGGAENLSQGDREYIQKIMSAMPDDIQQLFFPVILMPEKKIVPYIAVRAENEVEIHRSITRFIEC